MCWHGNCCYGNWTGSYIRADAVHPLILWRTERRERSVKRKGLGATPRIIPIVISVIPPLSHTLLIITITGALIYHLRAPPCGLACSLNVCLSVSLCVDRVISVHRCSTGLKTMARPSSANTQVWESPSIEPELYRNGTKTLRKWHRWFGCLSVTRTLLILCWYFLMLHTVTSDCQQPLIMVFFLRDKIR